MYFEMRTYHDSHSALTRKYHRKPKLEMSVKNVVDSMLEVEGSMAADPCVAASDRAREFQLVFVAR